MKQNYIIQINNNYSIISITVVFHLWLHVLRAYFYLI